MSGYYEACKAILKANGPLLGSELASSLSKATAVSPTNARQILFRLKREGIIGSTEPMKFYRNQLLYFLPGQNITKKIREILPDHGKALNRIYQAFLDQDGFLLFSDFAKISAGAIDSQKAIKHKTVHEIYDDLLRLGVVEPMRTFDNSTVIVASESWVPRRDAHESRIRSRIQDNLVNRQVTEDLLRWLQRLNIAGWNATFLNTMDESVHEGINGFHWDAHGFSYLWGLYNSIQKDAPLHPSREKKGSLIVVESVLTRELKMYDLAGFISRVQIQYGRLRSSGNHRILPICFVRSIEHEALLLARAKGIMVVTLAEVFGTKIVEALESIRKIDPRDIDANAIAEILAKADEAGQDDKLGNIKGYLFAFLVATVFGAKRFRYRLGREFEVIGKGKCECDLVIDENEILIVSECKGFHADKMVELGKHEKDPDTVKKFFEYTCPLVKAATGKDVLPIFITSGRFSPEAVEYLDKLNNSKRMQKMLKGFGFPDKIYYDHRSLMELFGNQTEFSEHRQILKEFYRSR